MTDPDEALRFLALLGKDPATARFRFFAHKHNPRKKEIGPRKLVGFDPERIAQYQREGRGAYLAIGNSDGSGDDKKNILNIPALFNEWDDKPIAWQRTAWKELGLPEPSIQLETGGASIHSYWLLDKPLARDEWEPLQVRLIKHSGSDPACSDASRVMRLPGAWYIGPDGQQVAATKIISDSGKRYTVQQLLACMPDLQQELTASPSPPAPRTYPPRTLEQVREALQFIPEILPDTKQRGTFLKLAWGLLGAVREAGESDPMALALLEEHSPLVVDAAEYLKTEPTEITASTFWGMARKAGWRPASSSTANVEQVVDGLSVHGDNSQQQGQQQPKPFQVLGWCKAREKVWYRHRQTAQIASVKPIGQSELIKLADLSYWSSCYPRKDKDGNRIGINWPHAACALIADANKAGIFELEQVRGRGVWLDGEQVVWHLGDRLEVDGQETPLAALQSVQHYGLMPRLEIDLKAEPLDDDHGRKILEVLKDRGWQGPSDHLHLAGFCVLSNVCGALRKRPGLQITSAFGRGKSDTIDNAILPLQGGIGRISTGSTEAGIRQLIGRDALPATIDESEAEDGRKREAQLRLVRYSFDGIPVVKGTPSGDAMTFCLRSSLALSGINSPIDNPADRSRIAVISPRHLPKDQWNQLEKRRSTLITVEIGQRLMRRTVSNLPALLANITTFGHLISAMIPSTEGGRTGDTFGALLAGAHHLTSTRQINEIEALDWLDLMGWEIGHTNTDETDRSAGAEGRQCLEHLLSHELRWIIPYEPDAGRPSTGSLTVRELLDLAKNSPCSIDGQEARSELGRKGMHITEQGLAVARTSEGGKKIFEATKWANGGHSDRLLELEGATRAPSTIAFPKGGSHRAVLLPWAVVGPLGELDSTARGSAF